MQALWPYGLKESVSQTWGFGFKFYSGQDHVSASAGFLSIPE